MSVMAELTSSFRTKTAACYSACHFGEGQSRDRWYRGGLIGGTHLVLVRYTLSRNPAALASMTDFRDSRNPKEPIYSHTATHSDDITHLSLLPPTSSFLPHSSSNPLPPRLLLSASTDGLVALSNLAETDEEEALLAEENWGQSIADAGAYAFKGKMKVWARSDMDGVANWDIGRGGEEEELQLQNMAESGTDHFRNKTFVLPHSEPSTAHTAAEERAIKDGKVQSNYLVDVVPSLGLSKSGTPIVPVGDNE